MGGIFREITSPERLVATEKFDESWYPAKRWTRRCSCEKGEITKSRSLCFTSRRSARYGEQIRHGVRYGSRLQPAGRTIVVAVRNRDQTRMIDPPQITQTTAQLTATIHLTVPRSEIQSVMGSRHQRI